MSGLIFFTRKIVEIPAAGLHMSTIAAQEMLDTYVHSNSSVILSLQKQLVSLTPTQHHR